MTALQTGELGRPVARRRGGPGTPDRQPTTADTSPGPLRPPGTTLRLDRWRVRTGTGAPPAVSPGTTREQYQGARFHLLRLIAQAAPGSAIPSERTLSEQLGVSRGTIRTAIDDLVREGRMVRIQGSGTYVVDAKIDCPLRPQSVTVKPAAKGAAKGSAAGAGLDAAAAEPVSTTRILAITRSCADPETAALLNIAAGEFVVTVERIREVDDQPIALERSHLPYDRFPDLAEAAATATSLHQVLSTRYKIKPRIGIETIETAPALDREAKLLEMTPGVPLLVICRQTFDENDVPIESARSAYRGDRCRFTTRPLIGW